jgi:hypothetical protein
MTGWTTMVVVAFWTIVLLAKVLVFPPPNGYRFSLRTLLTATTLVAVAIGLSLSLAHYITH